MQILAEPPHVVNWLRLGVSQVQFPYVAAVMTNADLVSVAGNVLVTVLFLYFFIFLYHSS